MNYSARRAIMEEAYQQGWDAFDDGSHCPFTHRALVANWKRGLRHRFADEAR